MGDYAIANLRLFKLPPEPEISALVNAYAGVIEGLHDPMREGGNAGHEALRDARGAGATVNSRRIQRCHVADGALHNLDFGTLPAAGSEPHYWIEDVTLSVVPSLDLLYRNLGRHPSRTGSLLLIGDPLPPDQKRFPKLLNAALEVRWNRAPVQPGRSSGRAPRPIPWLTRNQSPNSFPSSTSPPTLKPITMTRSTPPSFCPRAATPISFTLAT